MEPKSIENFFSIQRLLRESTYLIRSLFIIKIKEITKKEWKDDTESGKYFSSGEGKNILDKTLFAAQKKYLLEGDSNLWDLSLFRIIFSYKPFRNNSQFEFIKSISEIRNEVFHNATFSLSNQNFESLWTKLANFMFKLGYNKNKLNILKEKATNIIGKTNERLVNIKEEAKVEMKSKNYIKAIELYSKALLLSEISDEESSFLFSNRSLAYYKLYTDSKRKLDERNLLKSLNDALNASYLNEKWYKPYVRLGLIYKCLNDLEKSEENFRVAQVLLPDDEEIKNFLSDVKLKLFEMRRKANLDKHTFPYTIEELDQIKHENYGEKQGFDLNAWTKIEEFSKINQIKGDPSVLDVIKGHEYFHGSSRNEIDYVQAAMYYGKAASKGNPDGIYNLANMYEKGYGVLKDYKMAFKLLKEASDKEPFKNEYQRNLGVAEAEHLLGIWYANGIYVDQDHKIAVSYYKRAIEHDFAKSGNNLALMYFQGKGVERNLNIAEAYFLWAYRSGENLAISNLMNLYINRRDTERALLWHERALEKNLLFHKLHDEDIRKSIAFSKTVSSLNYVLDIDSLFKHLFCNQSLKKEEKKEHPNQHEKYFLDDPFRIYLIKRHRENLKIESCKLSDTSLIINYSFKPPKTQKSVFSNENQLRDIYLNEIDFTKDDVLFGYQLNAMIIEPPIYGVSVMFIIEDKNRNVERMAVYNLGENREKISRNFRIGARIIIKNPYIRVTADGNPMIRIDDPSSIEIQSNYIEKMCRYCGEENSKFMCSKCKGFFCCEECQLNDFKILNHKLVCFE